MILNKEQYDNNAKGDITSTTCTVAVQTCYRRGDVVVFNCIVNIPTGMTGNPEIIKLPWKAKGRYDFFSYNLSSSNKVCLYLADNSDSMTTNMGTVSIPSGNGYMIYGTYITNE